ncbi:MAG TPA: hypothetical protein PLT82_10720 [Candidatus Hydrogenedens sp.]|nr:hypothetical protein [Candidatus Hydrogenedens sp.]HOK10040.1 hypothetical protein [Candidatus Hydrogenedens sp.]HOL19967.1 hypothetical protein [Candidatus Hydrogenedens sp.]HPP59594.1 hypothetical protein [Candidatus Hydrogenedens sp.]
MRLVYLFIMVGITLTVTLITVPSLFFPKCKICGHRNPVGRTFCSHCKNKIELDYVAMINEEDKQEH